MRNFSDYYRTFPLKPRYQELSDHNIDSLQEREHIDAIQISQQRSNPRGNNNRDNNGVDSAEYATTRFRFENEIHHQQQPITNGIDEMTQSAIRTAVQNIAEGNLSNRNESQVVELIRNSVVERLTSSSSLNWSERHTRFALHSYREVKNQTHEQLGEDHSREGAEHTTEQLPSDDHSSSSSSVQLISVYNPNRTGNDAGGNVPHSNTNNDYSHDDDDAIGETGIGDESQIRANPNRDTNYRQEQETSPALRSNDEDQSRFSQSDSSESRSSDNMSAEIPESEMSNVDRLDESDADSMIKSENDHYESNSEDSAITWRNEEDISVRPSGSSISNHDSFHTSNEEDSEHIDSDEAYNNIAHDADNDNPSVHSDISREY